MMKKEEPQIKAAMKSMGFAMRRITVSLMGCFGSLSMLR